MVNRREAKNREILLKMGKAVFEPFTTIITPEFWSLLSRKKLEELKLNDDYIDVWGYFQLGRHSAPTFHITEDCFTSPQSSELKVK